MAINTSKKIKRVSYNQTDVPSGADISNVTVTRNDVLLGKRIVDGNGNIHTGTIRSMAGGIYSSAVTLQTSGKYLTSNIIFNLTLYRWLTPTIIKISTSGLVSLKLRSISKKIGINWGDGTARETYNATSSATTLSHSYASNNLWTIIIFPDSEAGASLASSADGTLYTFNSYMFGNDSSTSFSKQVEIIVGDGCAFYENALTKCTNIKTLDFSNNNSLIQLGDLFKTWGGLPANLCAYSTITDLILGTSILFLGNNCFLGSYCRNLIIDDGRSYGTNTTNISLGNGASLPSTISNKIFINHNKLESYKTATYWSARSSYMIGY